MVVVAVIITIIESISCGPGWPGPAVILAVSLSS